MMNEMVLTMILMDGFGKWSLTFLFLLITLSWDIIGCDWKLNVKRHDDESQNNLELK